MYELFLTALIEGVDLDSACAILAGYCGMQPWHSTERVVFFQGPIRPAGMGNLNSLGPSIRDRSNRKAHQFKELHQKLSKESFILQTRYDVSKDTHMGPNATPMDLNNTGGILRWTDFPDPPHSRPHITSRGKVEIWEQPGMMQMMANNQHTFKNECMEEMYRFYRDDTEFCLLRPLFLRPIDDHIPLEARTSAPSPPLSQLPAWDSLTPIDGQDRWTLLVKVHVVEDNKPDELHKAQEELNGIKRDLGSVFDFKSIDRKVHDTRVIQRQAGVQVLPQKVTVGNA